MRGTAKAASIGSQFGARALVAAAVCLAGAGLAEAQQVSLEDLRRSVWNTTYTTKTGQRVGATVILDGPNGVYDIPGAEGILSDVTYQTVDRNGGWTATISGRWSIFGQSGNFRWQTSSFLNPSQLNGEWFEFGQRGGSWTGNFAGVSEPAGTPAASGGGGATLDYGDWHINEQKGYCYRKCTFPAGGYQYLIYCKETPEWVYWYNPAKQVVWCRCPTVKHPQWGQNVANGEDLFAMATVKARMPLDCQFVDEGSDGSGFVQGSTTDRDGSTVALGCPPADLPADLP